jgi:hypothetical protein
MTMGITSPITSFIVDQESGFPAPSKHEKLNRAIDKYKRLLSKFGNRPDSNEMRFSLADLYVGRNEPEDYARAGVLYGEIMNLSGSANLRARTEVGQAELMVPGIKKEKIAEAIALCQKARHTLKDDLSDFFVAKTYIIEADLRLTRDAKDDHKTALKIHEKLIKDRSANWYFRARSLLGKGELILYHYPPKMTEGILLCQRAGKLLRERPGDYFALKAKVVEAELRMHRTKAGDFKAAEKLLKEVVSFPHTYHDLLGRARLNLADISANPLAKKYFNDFQQMEGVDPYLIDKAKLIAKKLKETSRQKRK